MPFAAAVLLIALGADYSIFGVGYIWAEARQRPLTEAIRVAVPRSTRAITAAGIALALSFASLAIVPLSPFREFAFAMGVGVLIDVFIVRSILVPGLITVIGTASGWPGRALRESPPRLPASNAPVQAATDSPSPVGQPLRPGALVMIAVAVGYAIWRRRRRRTL